MEYEDITWIHHSFYWDGPLAGIVKLKDGRLAWAQSDKDCKGNERQFSIYDVSDDFVYQSVRRHAQFEIALWLRNTLSYSGMLDTYYSNRNEYPSDILKRVKEGYPLIGEIVTKWYDYDEDDED